MYNRSDSAFGKKIVEIYASICFCPMGKEQRAGAFVFLVLYELDIFVWIQHGCLANTVFTLDPSNRLIKRLWCICICSLSAYVET